ncbi:MAG TPA: cytochrome c biogenesis protein CcdA [Anaeromyxobacter sp.]
MTLDLPGVFAAGLLTFLSPCVLPLVPLYLALLAGASVRDVRAGARPGRLVATALAFALGLAAVFVALGLAATAASRALSEHRPALLVAGGVAIALLGLKQMGLLRLPLVDRERRPLLERLRGGGSLAGAFAFGAAFALGWTPCVGPVLGAVLGYAASASSSPARGALLLGTYAAGLGAPLVAIAAMAPRALALLDRVKPHLRKIELATGAVLVVFGALLATDRLSFISSPSLRPSPPAAASSASSAAPAAGASCEGTGTGSSCAAPLPAAPAGDALAADLAAALATPKGPAVVEIVSTHCPVCERMAPVVAAAKGRCAGKHLRVEQRTIESDAGAALARSHAVRGVPTFLLLDGQGAEVARLVGEQPLAALEKAMVDLTGGRCTERDAPAGS